MSQKSQPETTKSSVQKIGPQVLSRPGLSKAGLRSGKHILLVDDDQAVAMMYQKTLQKIGFDITVVTDAVKAFDQFESDPMHFDIVIADKSMPYLSGYELTKKLHRLRPNIPVIIASGHEEELDSETRRSIGIRAFAKKPISVIELTRLIDSILARGEYDRLIHNVISILTILSVPHLL